MAPIGGIVIAKLVIIFGVMSVTQKRQWTKSWVNSVREQKKDMNTHKNPIDLDKSLKNKKPSGIKSQITLLKEKQKIINLDRQLMIYQHKKTILYLLMITKRNGYILGKDMIEKIISLI